VLSSQYAMQRRFAVERVRSFVRSAVQVQVQPVRSSFRDMHPTNEQLKEGMAATIGIEITELTKDKVTATMPVDQRTKQPFGLLHGGASAALAETVASLGAYMNCDAETQAAVGLELNANHIRGKTEGIVTATAIPLHRGRSTQVWEIRIVDEEEKLVCISRCTLAIVNRRERA
jgi:1,4-dihydroxy-2-naphthoyl-CoA hydrolase